jgi:hypothetical protein
VDDGCNYSIYSTGHSIIDTMEKGLCQRVLCVGECFVGLPAPGNTGDGVCFINRWELKLIVCPLAEDDTVEEKRICMLLGAVCNGAGIYEAIESIILFVAV